MNKKWLLVVVLLVLTSGVSQATDRITGRSVVCNSIGQLDTKCMNTPALPADYQIVTEDVAIAKASAGEPETHQSFQFVINDKAQVKTSSEGVLVSTHFEEN